jgi:hypothetical protein
MSLSYISLNNKSETFETVFNKTNSAIGNIIINANVSGDTIILNTFNPENNISIAISGLTNNEKNIISGNISGDTIILNTENPEYNVYISGLTGANIIDISHNDLKFLIESNNLSPLNYYKIIDYVTIHPIPSSNGVIYSGSTEPLIVQALSNNTITKYAFSELYPNDIIHYDINGVSPDIDNQSTYDSGLGWITYRLDTINNNSTYYDFRNVTFRRYALDYAEYFYTQSSSYVLGQKVYDTNANGIYQCIKDGQSDEEFPSNDSERWVLLISLVDNSTIFSRGYVSYYSQWDLDLETFTDYKTFNDSYTSYNVHTDKISFDNVFWDNNNTKLGINCIGNTFININGISSLLTNNILKNDCNNNIIINSYNTTLNDGCQKNIINQTSFGNTLEKSVQNSTILNSHLNIIGKDSYDNVICNGSSKNKLFESCYNVIFNSSYDNEIGINSYDIVLKSCSNNRINKQNYTLTLESSYSNVLENDVNTVSFLNCYNNFINSGSNNINFDLVYNSTIGYNCNNIQIQNSYGVEIGEETIVVSIENSSKNKIGTNCGFIAFVNSSDFNEVGNNSGFIIMDGQCSYNKVNSSCGDVIIQNYCSFNKVANNCSQINISTTSNDNEISEGCNTIYLINNSSNNKIGSNIYDLTFDSCQLNTINSKGVDMAVTFGSWENSHLNNVGSNSNVISLIDSNFNNFGEKSLNIIFNNSQIINILSSCQDIEIIDSNNINIGVDCSDLNLNNCQNIDFGNRCNTFTFDNGGNTLKFGDECENFILNNDIYLYNSEFEDRCKNLTFNSLSHNLKFDKEITDSYFGNYTSEFRNCVIGFKSNNLNLVGTDITIGNFCENINISGSTYVTMGDACTNNININNSQNIKLDKFCQDISIDNCFFVKISEACYNNINITDSQNIKLDKFCEDITINNSYFIEMGDSNTYIEVYSCNGNKIGNNVNNIALTSSYDINIDDYCTDSIIEDSEVINIGKNCSNINITNSENIILYHSSSDLTLDTVTSLETLGIWKNFTNTEPIDNLLIEKGYYDFDDIDFSGSTEIYNLNVSKTIFCNKVNPLIEGVVDILYVISGGTNYSDGTYLSTNNGTGTGLIVDITTTGGEITGVSINDAGSGYLVGDIVEVLQMGSDSNGFLEITSVTTLNNQKNTYRMRYFDDTDILQVVAVNA